MKNIRHIQRQISRETYISRLPALFPYLTIDRFGNAILHSALDAANGCYGKIVPKLKGGKIDDVFGETENGVPYRVIMDRYYSMKRGEIAANDDFINFIDRAIGLLECNAEIDWNRCDLASRIHYLASIAKEYTEYQNTKALTILYEALKAKGEHDAGLCCTNEKYERMGGDKMLEWLGEHLADREPIATELLSYAVQPEIDVPCIHMNINLFGHNTDMGTVYPAITRWTKGASYYKEQLIVYNDTLYQVSKNINEETVCGSKWNEETQDYEFDDEVFQKVEFHEFPKDSKTISENRYTYTSESQLKECRRPVSFTNSAGEIETPDPGEDWLFYYRVGEPVNINVETDERGNILTLDGSGTYTRENLAITGNIIESINVLEETENGVQNKLQFKYVIGAHLNLAADYEIEDDTTDDDGNTIYRLPPGAKFVRDEKTGVEFEEVYICEDEETLLLMNGGKLDEEDDTPIEPMLSQYIHSENHFTESCKFDCNAKYPFSTVRNQIKYTAQFGDTSVEIPAISSTSTEFGSSGKVVPKITSKEIIIPYLRHEYQYGVSYPDEEKNDVYIRRGNAAAFERHIKLSEVKTMEDMENYANGGFFNMITMNG